MNHRREKTIWILNHFALSPSFAGGTRHYDFGRELTGRGYNVTIFASNFHYSTRTLMHNVSNGCYQEMIGGVRFLWIKSFPYMKSDWKRMMNMLSYTYGAIRVGMRLQERPDIIIGSSVHLFAGLAAYILAKRKRSRFVFEVRDLWPQTMVEIGPYKKSHPLVWLMYKLEKFLYQRAEKVITLLPKAEDYLADLGIEKGKVLYVPNGVAIDLEKSLNTKSQTLPEGLESALIKLKDEGKFIVAYTGAHGVANSLDTLVEAARIFSERKEKKVHFLLLGDGVEKERLVNKANCLNLNNISFFNAIPKESMPKLLSKVDAAIILLKKANLFKYGVSPNKLFDYMVAAKPIIMAIDTPNKIVEEIGCGKCVSTVEPEDVVEAVMEIYQMCDEERNLMGNKGREYVREHHSVPRLVDKLLDALEDHSS